MTSSYSETSVFVPPHENYNNAFSKPPLLGQFCGRKSRTVKTAKKIKTSFRTFTTLETRTNLGRVNFRKDFWDCYRGQVKQIGQQLNDVLSNYPRSLCKSQLDPVSSFLTCRIITLLHIIFLIQVLILKT